MKIVLALMSTLLGAPNMARAGCATKGRNCYADDDCCSRNVCHSTDKKCYDPRRPRGSLRVDKDKDIPPHCLGKQYGVYLHAVKGPHIGFAAEASNHEDTSCPYAFAFYAGDGQKIIEKYSSEDESPRTVSKIKLGMARLDDIFLAEESAQAPDEVGYDFEKNSCVHYARDMWRATQTDNGAVKETPELAEFIIENLVNDDGFINLFKEKMKVGGFRATAMLALGGKRALKTYLSDLVYGQLNIDDPTDEEEPEAIEPVDNNEVQVMMYLKETCPTESLAFEACYESNDAAMLCANCFWSGFIAGEAPDCNYLEAKIDSTMAACAEQCNDACAGAEGDLRSCAVSSACGHAGAVISQIV